MRRLRPVWLIPACWLVATAWLIRYEAFPEWFVGRTATYRDILGDGLLVLDSWMRVSFNDRPIGFTHTWLDSDTVAGRQQYTLRNQTALSLNLLGQTRSVSLTLGATLDDTHRLMDFYTFMQSEGYSTRITGRRTGPQNFHITIRTPHDTIEHELALPDDVLLHTPLNELIVSRLAPGQSTLLRVFNPLTMAIEEVRVTAVGRETITLDGETYETMRLRSFYQGMEMQAWVDSTGRALRQETAFGLTMEMSSPALAGLPTAADPAADMLRDMAVTCDRPIAQAHGLAALDLRIHGAPDAARLAGERRRILRQTGDYADLRIFRQTAPAADPAEPPAELREWLQPAPGLQSDHPLITARARAIADGRPPGWDVARDIGAWVYANVEKQTAISLPSAVDVLRELTGDCNEHTYLYTALARAAGMPARIHVGLVYAELDNYAPAFYYHAWPAVWLGGRWIESDPTLGLELAGATHITLVTGGIDRQIELLGLMGRLRKEGLAEHAQPPVEQPD